MSKAIGLPQAALQEVEHAASLLTSVDSKLEVMANAIDDHNTRLMLKTMLADTRLARVHLEVARRIGRDPKRTA